MAKLTTHGLIMRGIRKASGETVDWDPRSGGYTQISYDMATGDIMTNDHIGESWSKYHDPDVITICHTRQHMTMQEIADAIAQKVSEHKQLGIV